MSKKTKNNEKISDVLVLRSEIERASKHCAIKHLSFVAKTNIQEVIEKIAIEELKDYVSLLTEALIITSGVLHELASKNEFTLSDLLEYLVYLRQARSKVAKVILDIKDIAKKLENVGKMGVEAALLDELLYVNGNIYAAELHIVELIYKIVQKLLLSEVKQK